MSRRALPGNDPLALQRDALEYRAARAAAQEAANADGFDRGIERCGVGPLGGWRTFLLPARQYRRGFELACEVVMPERGWREGHGL